MAGRRKAPARKVRNGRARRVSAGVRGALVFTAVGCLVAFGWWIRPRHLPPVPTPPPKLVSPAERAAARAHARAAAEAAGPTGGMRRDGAAPRSRTAPRIAIVIDDLGDDLATARRVLALEPAVTVAVIPFREASAAVAAAAVESGREVILHLPLEPERGSAMTGGSGFLRTGMEPDRIESQLERDLRAVPYIVGVNGHMGSRFTSDPRAMRTLLAALRARGLFFLDSKTSPESVAAEVAAGLQVPFAERNVFLDHDPSPSAVARALALAASVARDTGQAIAIGHPHASTLSALAAWLPAAARDGVEFVPVSALVR